MINNQFKSFIQKMHAQKKEIVLVTGVFDVLHQEHLNFLTKAKDLADVLVVGLESDVRVREIKGQGRPVHNQDQRLESLENLGIADFVFVLPEEFSKPIHHQELIGLIRPKFLAVSEHSLHQDKKREILEKYGGQLRVVHRHNPDVSSTKIIESQQKT